MFSPQLYCLHQGFDHFFISLSHGPSIGIRDRDRNGTAFGGGGCKDTVDWTSPLLSGDVFNNLNRAHF